MKLSGSSFYYYYFLGGGGAKEVETLGETPPPYDRLPRIIKSFFPTNDIHAVFLFRDPLPKFLDPPLAM